MRIIKRKKCRENTTVIFYLITGKVKESLDEVGQTEALKKAGEFTQKAGEFTQNIGQKAGSAAETLGKSDFVKTASTAAATIKEE